MNRYVAFLRAVNVGGRNAKMDHLRSVFEALGFSNVETFIASGNVIFETPSTDESALEKKISRQLEKSLGYDVEVFIRRDVDLAQIAAYQPFKTADVAAARTLNVAFVREPLSPGALAVLISLKTDVDDFHAKGREVYWLSRVKQSESTFTNAVFERLLKVRATFRGVNTVAKIAAKWC